MGMVYWTKLSTLKTKSSDKERQLAIFNGGVSMEGFVELAKQMYRGSYPAKAATTTSIMMSDSEDIRRRVWKHESRSYLAYFRLHFSILEISSRV